MKKDREKLYTLEDAIDRAIKDLPKDFKILGFIMKNREEVKDVCLFEYDEERHMRQEREEGMKKRNGRRNERRNRRRYERRT